MDVLLEFFKIFAWLFFVFLVLMVPLALVLCSPWAVPVAAIILVAGGRLASKMVEREIFG